MNITVKEAAGKLAELVARAEAGEEVRLTRDGRIVATLAAAKPDRPGETDAILKPSERLKRLEELSARAGSKAMPGPDAAQSQDFLYDGDGLPA